MHAQHTSACTLAPRARARIASCALPDRDAFHSCTQVSQFRSLCVMEHLLRLLLGGAAGAVACAQNAREQRQLHATILRRHYYETVYKSW